MSVEYYSVLILGIEIDKTNIFTSINVDKKCECCNSIIGNDAVKTFTPELIELLKFKNMYINNNYDLDCLDGIIFSPNKNTNDDLLNENDLIIGEIICEADEYNNCKINDIDIHDSKKKLLEMAKILKVKDNTINIYLILKCR